MSEEALEKALDAVAAKYGVKKSVLLQALRDAVRERRSVDGEEILKALEAVRGGDVIDKLLQARLVEKLTGGDDLDLNKILAVATIRQLFQPDPTTLMLLDKVSKAGGGGGDQVAQLVLQFMQQQQQMQQQLMQLLFGKRVEEVESKIVEVAKRGEEERRQLLQQLDERIGQLAQMMQQLPPNQRRSLEEEIAEALGEELKRQIVDAVLDRFRGESRIVQPTEGGKPTINVGAVLDRGLRILEEFVRKMPAQPPPKAEVKEVPQQGEVVYVDAETGKPVPKELVEEGKYVPVPEGGSGEGGGGEEAGGGAAEGEGGGGEGGEAPA